MRMHLDAAPLTRFQRMLLGTDGTVTHILEAYADEPIQVQKLLQVVDTASDADTPLDVAGDEKVLRRRVVLRGRRSGQALLYAEATVAMARVDPVVLDGLLGTDKPIGILLAESRTETFRETLLVGRAAAGPCGAHFTIAATAELVYRTYRIAAGGQPIILVTEKFPPALFRALPE